MCDLLLPGFTSKKLPGTHITFSLRQASKNPFHFEVSEVDLIDLQRYRNYLEADMVFQILEQTVHVIESLFSV